MSEQKKYRMTVDLNVLDHLGINLYSNIAAVLTEAVANSWDADAHRVDITIDKDNDRIEIKDDGVGMSVDDINLKYLRVGYRRREDKVGAGSETPGGRKVMGRKGLGKLSLFSIAKTIEVHSVREGLRHGLRMTDEGIREAANRGDRQYCPEELAESEARAEKGTTILLRNIKRQRLEIGTKALRMRLARRFSIIGERHSFKVFINNDEITPADRVDFGKVQFLWQFGEDGTSSPPRDKIEEFKQLSDRIEGWEEGWFIKGWIGTVRLPKDLDSKEMGNLNGIVVMSRGRLFQENILERMSKGGLYSKYLTGQIEADFLDADGSEDIATSDRQRIQEDDPRFNELWKFLERQISVIANSWTELRKDREVERARRQIPALAEWLDSMPEGFRDSASELIHNLGSLAIEKDEDRELLYRHGILAFERMKLRGSTEELSACVNDTSKLLKLFGDRDSFEASMYRDIVKSRIEVINFFHNLTDSKEKEKVLQKFLFEHLWLLDPAWERATGSEVMESRLLKEGVIVEDLTEKERLGRVDIAYRTVSGKHIIVELKRPGNKQNLHELVIQGTTYAEKSKKILKSAGESNPHIEVIFVIHAPLEEEESNPARLMHQLASISPGSRIVHYDELIAGAKKAYSEYLEASKKIDKLEGIIERIGKGGS